MIDLGQLVVHDGVDRGVEVGVVAARATDVEDVGRRRHGVHGLDVEGLLAVPAGRRRTRRCSEYVAGQGLGELVAPQRVPRVVAAGVGLGVGEDRRRGVARRRSRRWRRGRRSRLRQGGVDAVGAPQLRRLVAAGGVGAAGRSRICGTESWRPSGRSRSSRGSRCGRPARAGERVGGRGSAAAVAGAMAEPAGEASGPPVWSGLRRAEVSRPLMPTTVPARARGTDTDEALALTVDPTCGRSAGRCRRPSRPGRWCR